MTDINVVSKNIKAWIRDSLRNLISENSEIEIKNQNKETGGYLGNIIFVGAETTLKSGEKKVFHLVLKLSQQNQHLRNLIPLSEIYEREIYVYSVIVPFYNKFLNKKNSPAIDFLPKCYNTVVEENVEVLVLQNLIQEGYQLHDPQKTMDVAHIKGVLNAYAKWHAVSFCVRDQKRQDFDRLASAMKDVIAEYNKNEDHLASRMSGLYKLENALIEHGDYELLQKLNYLLRTGVSSLLDSLFYAKEKDVVVTHGDCWNNNFLFKYNDSTSEPDKVVIIDWQNAYIRSPVFDLSYFLYLVSSKEELGHFDELMQIYHASLCENMMKLGSDPQEIFPFSTLMAHWKKYALYGLLNAPFM